MTMMKNLLSRAEEQMKDGIKWWKSIMRQYGWTAKDFIIVLADNQDVNNLIFSYLAKVKEQYQAERIFLFALETVEFPHKQVIMEQIYYDTLTESEYRALAALYRLYKFTDRIVFADSTTVSESNSLNLIQTNKVTLDDIVRIAILGLDGRVSKVRTAMSANVQRLIDSGTIKQGEGIFLFGDNSNAKRLIEFYLKDYNVEAVLDNDIRKSGSLISGVPIKFPEQQLLSERKKVLIAANHYSEMLAQLQEIGYQENKDVFVVATNENASDEELVELDWRMEQLKAGAEAYAEFLERYPSTWLFYNPRATGNTYLLGRYILDYVERNGIDNYIVFNKKKSSWKLCELMGVPAQIAGSDIELICNFADVVGWKELQVKTMDPYSTRTNLIRIRGYKGLDFHSIYQYVLFECDKLKTEPRLRQNNTEKLFAEWGLQAGKTVLISPYSYTVNTIEKKVWEQLIVEIKKLGYEVCINCSNDEEKWEGEKCVFLPYFDVVDFVDRAGVFLGVRSGLCDILSEMNGKMIILCPEKQSEQMFQYFSIRNMGLKKENLLEICDANRMEVISEVVSFLNE